MNPTIPLMAIAEGDGAGSIQTRWIVARRDFDGIDSWGLAKRASGAHFVLGFPNEFIRESCLGGKADGQAGDE